MYPISMIILILYYNHTNFEDKTVIVRVICIRLPMYFYLVVLVGLAHANDPENYISSSVATNGLSQAKQVEG
jgi:hypothetical protein